MSQVSAFQNVVHFQDNDPFGLSLGLRAWQHQRALILAVDSTTLLEEELHEADPPPGRSGHEAVYLGLQQY